MKKTLSKTLVDEAAMVAFGTELGLCSQQQPRLTVFLKGDLGMGKTTLCRGVLQAYGHHAAVKSPTYTLVEPYELGQFQVYHFDLYRLGDPEELEYMGIRDYFSENGLCLVEWPEKGRGFLPQPDLTVSIAPELPGRVVTVSADTAIGSAIVEQLAGASR